MKKNKSHMPINGYKKIGRIRMAVAQKAHIKAADIMIDENHIKHIFQKHNRDLSSCGIEPILIVQTIVNNFDEIRSAKDGALYLILTQANKPLVTVIALNYNTKKEFWEVKTAFPSRKAVLKSELIWKKGANPLQ